MGLENLKKTPGSTHSKRIVGRGYGSKGKTAGRGMNGAGQRAGKEKGIGFAGGQTPLYKRLAKRGFTHVFKKEYAIVNVCQLSVFENGATVDREALINAGLIDKDAALVKILGNGDLNVQLTVKADKVSEGAKAKIENAKGQVEVI